MTQLAPNTVVAPEHAPRARSRHAAPNHVLAAVSSDLSAKMLSAGLDFGPDHTHLVRGLVASLATKPFVIFSGLSGAGKTRLAIALGQWFGREQLHVEAVRPDWETPDALLGKENLSSQSIDNRHAWTAPRTLEFVLKAARDPGRPYLLVLEEMNLAHVERYFADVLSGMESGHPIVPNLEHDSTGWRMPKTAVQYVPWPENLFLVGTVNNDETTYKFSPKVLDRANVIEFRVLPSSLRTDRTRVASIDRGETKLVEAFLRHSLQNDPAFAGREQLGLALQRLHALLFEFDNEFGHRVFQESLRMGSMLAECGEKDFKAVLDYIVLYKVLPKLDNSDFLCTDLLEALTVFARDGGRRSSDKPQSDKAVAMLPLSYAKLRRLSARARRRSS